MRTLAPGCRIILTFSVLNGLAVRWYGMSEFYMSIFKVFLMLGLMSYTFITMVGGNPRHDAYGFRYWNDPVGFLLVYALLTFRARLSRISFPVTRDGCLV